MSSDDYLCIHLTDTRYSRCGLCMDSRPRGFTHTEARRPVPGPEREAAEWAGARDVLPAAPYAGGQRDNDWAELSALAEIEQPDMSRWAPARWDGTCAGCGFRWEPGDLIRYCEDEQGWICSECGST